MTGFYKTVLASALIVAGMASALAAPDRRLQDQSGEWHVQDQSGTWHSSAQRRNDRGRRTPIAARRNPIAPFTLEEERSFERASAPATG